MATCVLGLPTAGFKKTKRALFGMLRIKHNIYIIIQNKPTTESKREKKPLKHDKVSFHPAATITI